VYKLYFDFKFILIHVFINSRKSPLHFLAYASGTYIDSGVNIFLQSTDALHIFLSLSFWYNAWSVVTRGPIRLVSFFRLGLTDIVTARFNVIFLVIF